MTQQEIEKRLESLRKDWREKPEMRDIIERQAKLLKKCVKKSLGQVDFETVKKIFCGI